MYSKVYLAGTVSTRCRPNRMKMYWPTVECYRRRQTPESITSLAPTLCVGEPVIRTYYFSIYISRNFETTMLQVDVF